MTQNEDKKSANVNYAALVAIGSSFLVLGMVLDGAVRWVFLAVALIMLSMSLGGSLAAIKAQREQGNPESESGPEDVTPR